MNADKGRAAIWWLIASEIVIFGGFVACYLLYRLRLPGWGEIAAQNSLVLGGINTVLLAASGICVSRAAFHAKGRDFSSTALFLVATMALALAFLGVKGYEYAAKISHGRVPGAHLFWDFYYGLTGLHALHIVAGLVVFAVVLAGVRRDRHWQRVELAGIYWQLVDSVWILLFALLYVPRISLAVLLPAAGLVAGAVFVQSTGLRRDPKLFRWAAAFSVLCLAFLFLGVYPDVTAHPPPVVSE